jgi:two-component system, response regulator
MSKQPILLVDDNADDVDLTVRSLRAAHLANPIEIVRDGAEALDYLFGEGVFRERAVAVQPALVLLDLNLPKVPGLKVLERMREDERTKHVPVVIVTVSQDQDDAVRGQSLGIHAYVQKPVDFDVFRDVARRLRLSWTVQDEPPPPRMEPP